MKNLILILIIYFFLSFGIYIYILPRFIYIRFLVFNTELTHLSQKKKKKEKEKKIRWDMWYQIKL